MNFSFLSPGSSALYAAVIVLGSLFLPACPAMVNDGYHIEDPRSDEGPDEPSGSPLPSVSDGSGGNAGAPDLSSAASDAQKEEAGAGGKAGASGAGSNPVQPAAPECDDGEKNGGESDVDCGLVCPTLCGVGEACDTGDDCKTGHCSDGKCRENKGKNKGKHEGKDDEDDKDDLTSDASSGSAACRLTQGRRGAVRQVWSVQTSPFNAKRGRTG